MKWDEWDGSLQSDLLVVQVAKYLIVLGKWKKIQQKLSDKTKTTEAAVRAHTSYGKKISSISPSTHKIKIKV